MPTCSKQSLAALLIMGWVSACSSNDGNQLTSANNIGVNELEKVSAGDQIRERLSEDQEIRRKVLSYEIKAARLSEITGLETAVFERYPQSNQFYIGFSMSHVVRCDYAAGFTNHYYEEIRGIMEKALNSAGVEILLTQHPSAEWSPEYPAVTLSDKNDKTIRVDFDMDASLFDDHPYITNFLADYEPGLPL